MVAGRDHLEGQPLRHRHACSYNPRKFNQAGGRDGLVGGVQPSRAKEEAGEELIAPEHELVISRSRPTIDLENVAGPSGDHASVVLLVASIVCIAIGGGSGRHSFEIWLATAKSL